MLKIPTPDREEILDRLSEKILSGESHGKIIQELKDEEISTLKVATLKVRHFWKRVAKKNLKKLQLAGTVIQIIRLLIELKKKGEIMDYLRTIIKGDSLLGKILFAILDVLPIPNFQEIFKSVWKKHPDLSVWEKLKMVVSKIDLTRTIVAILVAVALAMGWVTPEMITEVLP